MKSEDYLETWMKKASIVGWDYFDVDVPASILFRCRCKDFRGSTLTLPPVEIIGEWALEGVEAKRVIIPPTVKVIGGGAFRNAKIEEFDLPDTIEFMGGGIYEDRSPILKDNPLRILKIGMNINIDNLFSSTDNFKLLEEINVSPSNPYYTSIDGVLYDKQVTKLLIFPKKSPIKHYKMPDSITEFGRLESRGYLPQFFVRQFLETIKLSDQLTNLTFNTFVMCLKLRLINLGKGITEVSVEELVSMNPKLKIVIGENLLSIIIKSPQYRFNIEKNHMKPVSNKIPRKVVYVMMKDISSPKRTTYIFGRTRIEAVILPFIDNPENIDLTELYDFPIKRIKEEDSIYFDKYVFKRKGFTESLRQQYRLKSAPSE